MSRLVSFCTLIGTETTLFLAMFGFLLVLVIGTVLSTQSNGTDGVFTGEYSRDLPIFDEIKGTGPFSDEVAQLSVGTAVKYRLLPSVILSQWAYESSWGTSLAAQNDHNYFGITWFVGCPFPKGTARGIGGAEGGWYMRFPDAQSSFSYYGFMVATQTNFNACVGNKSPSECLLILGRGGYAAAGITESSPYFTSCLSIITSNQLEAQYDTFAIEHWQTGNQDSSRPGIGNSMILNQVLGQSIYGGQCYGMTAYYVDQLGGPQLMGSGFINACDIGTDYNWGAYGWVVIQNPSFSDFQSGDIINYKAFSVMGPTQYGHTGVIANVLPNGQYTTFEQNDGKGQIVANHQRGFLPNTTASLVRKVT